MKLQVLQIENISNRKKNSFQIRGAGGGLSQVDLKEYNNAGGKNSWTFMIPLDIYDLFVLNLRSNN